MGSIVSEENVRPGMGDGGSGNVVSTGSCRILNENWISPSANSDVSGKLENALGSVQKYYTAQIPSEL